MITHGKYSRQVYSAGGKAPVTIHITFLWHLRSLLLNHGAYDSFIPWVFPNTPITFSLYNLNIQDLLKAGYLLVYEFTSPEKSTPAPTETTGNRKSPISA